MIRELLRMGVGLVCLTIMAAMSYAAQVGSKDKDVVRFPAFGVAFSPPAGWTEMPRDKQKRIGTWGKMGSEGRQADATISVEGGMPTDDTLDKAVERFASLYEGKVLPMEVQMDGERSLRVRIEKGGSELHPVEALFAFHRGAIYMIIGAARDGHECASAVEDIRKTWKWIEFESPLKAPVLDPRPTLVFGGNISLRLPVNAYSWPIENPQSVEEWGLRYLGDNNSPFIVRVTTVQRNPQLTLAETGRNLVEGLGRTAKFGHAPEWRQVAGPTERRMTSSVEVTIPNGTKVHVQLALVVIGEKELAFLNFTELPSSPEERANCDKLAEEIVKSVQRNKPADASKKP